MSYSDFVDLLIPLEPYYENLVKDRVRRNQKNQFSFFELYSHRTRECVRALFQLAAANEHQLAALRRDLIVAKNDQAHRETIFELLDVRGNGRVESAQLQRFCVRNGLPLSSSELELLLRRLDKNSDSAVTYNDFLKEMTH